MRELSRFWGLFVLRAALAALLALAIFTGSDLLRSNLSVPLHIALIFLSGTFGLFMIADGAALLLLALRLPKEPYRPALFGRSVLSLTFGALMLAAIPLEEAVRWFLWLSIAQSGVTGAGELVLARHLQHHAGDRFIFRLAGIVSLCFCFALLVWRGDNGRTLLGWLAAYAISFAVSMLLFAWRLRTLEHHLRENHEPTVRAAHRAHS
jgi:uncharacterized membrane protein HdeD (DUF308 family)